MSAIGNPAVEVQGLSIEYDLRLSPHRTLRQALSDVVARRSADIPTVWALRDVTFTLRQGESLGIVGDNGSGKSTLLLALAGILRPDRGRVVTYGRASTLLTLGAGFEVTETGLDNIYLNAAFLGVPRKVIEARIPEIVAFAELEDFIDVAVAKYSSGMRARLGFAIASHIEPDILLLDEVLSVGDASFKDRSEQRIKELVGTAKAIVVVSHILPFVREVCTKVLWIESGRVRGFGDPDEVLEAYAAAPPVPARRHRPELVAP
jgi:ABC-type polysaccharide/polyol phosphate transport system ATPase subunit